MPGDEQEQSDDHAHDGDAAEFAEACGQQHVHAAGDEGRDGGQEDGAEAAGEQAVAIGHLAHVLVGAAGGHNGPGAAVLPQVDVVLGVEGHHPLASGARGGLDTHAIL